MADKEIKFLLNLDSTDFMQGILQAKGTLETMADPTSMEGLVTALEGAGVALGVIGVAALAVKESLDLTEEGEHIRQINTQFNTLAASAGIAGDKLKEGLEQSAQGFIDNTDLMEIANKSIVTMGASASRLPEIMDLARKATAVFGGTLKDNFETMSQAIAVGNTRILKHYGIVVNATKAVEDFAKAHGLTASEVSESGKRQALLNAVIDQGTKTYQGMNIDINNATNTMQALKVTVGELKETFTLAFEKTIGPTVRTVLQGVTSAAKQLSTWFKDEYGEGADQAQAHTERLQQKIQEVTQRINELKAKQLKGDDWFPSFTQAKINTLSGGLQKLQSELEATQAKSKQFADQEKQDAQQKAAIVAKASQDSDIVNHEARLKNEQAYQAEVLKLQTSTVQLEGQQVNSLAEVEKNLQDQKLLSEQQHIQKLQQIKQSVSLEEGQKKKLIEMEERNYQNQRRIDEQNTEATREKLLQNYQKNAEKSFAAIGRSFQVHAMQMRAQMTDFGKRGEEIFTSFQTHGTFAFEQIGQGIAQNQSIASSAAAAMKGMFLNMIADRAAAEGSMLLLEGIWPPNPIAIAAGAGLLALAGFLRTEAGGAANTVAGATGGGPGVSGGIGVVTQPAPGQSSSGAAASPQTASDQMASNVSDLQTRQKQVNISIAGNYFDTDQTRRQLLDMIRAESDATDFRYTKIGQT